VFYDFKMTSRWPASMRLRRNFLAGIICVGTLAFSGYAVAQAGVGTPATSVAPGPALKETHWNLIELNGDPVTAASAESQPYIYLHSEGDKLSGSGGCNRLFGSFDLSGNSLQFHSVASTRMACADNSMEHEPALLEALKLVSSYRIEGDTLILRVDDRVLARFRSVLQR